MSNYLTFLKWGMLTQSFAIIGNRFALSGQIEMKSQAYARSLSYSIF